MFDIIGDIHGQHGKLVALLAHLDYREIDGVWRHPNRGNLGQHQAFLREVENTPRYAEIIEWFKTLPLWLELPGLRIVHACWHQASMDVLMPLLGPNRTLTDAVVLAASRRGDPMFEALEVVCKGRSP